MSEEERQPYKDMACEYKGTREKPDSRGIPLSFPFVGKFN